MNGEIETPVWLRRFTKLTAFSTLFLIFAGAMVTSTGSGLAVPDWPLSYGMLMPPMVGGIFYEHGHRMIATLVGFFVLVQAFWLQRSESRRFLRRLGWISLAAVIVQGLLGGLTVILLLPTAISVGHASIAEIFFCLNVAIAFYSSRYFQSAGTSEAHSPLQRLSALIVLATFAQIFFGAVMRHLGAGLAIPDFPLSFGRLVPAFTSLEIGINFVHRVWAFVVAALIFVALFKHRTSSVSRGKGAVRALAILVIVQITLGAMTIWSGRNPLLTSVHVATGAATLALAVIFALTQRGSIGRPASESVVLQRGQEHPA